MNNIRSNRCKFCGQELNQPENITTISVCTCKAVKTTVEHYTITVDKSSSEGSKHVEYKANHKKYLAKKNKKLKFS